MMDGSTATSKSMLPSLTQQSTLVNCPYLGAVHASGGTPPLFRLGFLGAGLIAIRSRSKLRARNPVDESFRVSGNVFRAYGCLDIRHASSQKANVLTKVPSLSRRRAEWY